MSSLKKNTYMQFEVLKLRGLLRHALPEDLFLFAVQQQFEQIQQLYGFVHSSWLALLSTLTSICEDAYKTCLHASIDTD
jgi:hypothetical protein